MGLIYGTAHAAGTGQSPTTLTEGQSVVLAVADVPAVDRAGLPCTVAAVSRLQVALVPQRAVSFASIPSTIGDTYLAFEHNGRPVGVRGVAAAVALDDLRFCPLDGVQLCHRRSTRLRTSLEIVVTPLEGLRAGLIVAGRTVDISATGVLLAGEHAVEPGVLVDFELTLASSEEPVTGVARTVRGAGGKIALDFTDVDGAERRRLDDHIVAAKRARFTSRTRV